MKKTGLIWVIIFITGFIILIIPDHSDPVFKLNSLHGPSLVDLIGIVLMLISWLASIFIVIRNHNLVVQKIGKNVSLLMLFFYFLSLAGIASALKLSNELMLWICITIACIINLCFIIFSFKR